MFNKFFANYFGFNKQQRNGLLVLILISFVLLVVRIAYPYFIKPDPIVIQNLPLVEKELDSLSQLKHYPDSKYKKEPVVENKHANLFAFNPNKVTREQLVKLGFKPKAAKAFIKFRKKGFVFKTKSDLKKVYGVSDKFYAKLEPYIILETEVKKEKKIVENKTPEKTATKKTTRQQIDLNSADSLALINLNGIGPTYAKRILKYRNILGGFVSVDQLKEVYGFNEELYAKVNSYFIVGNSGIRKINLNKDDFKTINRHPYLTYELTKSISNMRKRTTIDRPVLKGILNDEALYEKLLPYLRFD